MVTGMHPMRRKGYATGLISMCIGGGMGMAMIIERYVLRFFSLLEGQELLFVKRN